MTGIVGGMWQKIADLDQQAKELRRESNDIVGFVPGEDGTPQQQVSDPVRFAEIGKQFKQIAAQKAYYESILAKIKDLIGENDDNCLSRLSGNGYIVEAQELRLGMKDFIIKALGRHQPFPLPSEIMETGEYKELAGRIEPEIRRLEAQAAADRELSDKVVRIIMNQ
jgi:hypothetical protein